MENKTLIDSFTSKFLTFGRITLLLLFSCASFNWYSSTDSMPSNVTTFINLIGSISFLAWVYAIGQRGNEILTRQNISIPEFKYYNWGFIAIFSALFTMYFISSENVSLGNGTGNLTYHLTYTKPFAGSLFLVVSLIFVLFVSAKSLTSAELRREANFEEYFKTILMLAFPWIGLWFIQPRVKSLF